MRIETLTLNQYRQYRDCKIDFKKPLRNGFDLNVLVGLNGAGKTNIANAICWCLWDIEPDLALQGKNTGKGRLNDKTRERLKTLGKTTGEVRVELKISLDDYGNEELIVARTCECAIESGLEHQSKVTVTHASPDKYEGRKVEVFHGEDAELEIESYLPRDISSYLIFDGEQLTGYFRSDRAAKVKTAMLALSGVGKLNVALEHHAKQLADIDRGVSDHSHEVGEWETRKRNAETAYAQNETNISEYAAQSDKLRESIEKLTEFIGSHKNVPELIKQKEYLDGALQRIKNSFARIKDEKCELIRSYYPALAVFPTAMKLKSFIGKKREKSELPPPLKREFFEEILKIGKCRVCGEALSEKARKEIQRQIELYDKKIMATDTSDQLTKLMEPQILALIERVRNYQSVRDHILREESTLLANEEQVEVELQKVNEQLAQVNDTKAYQDAIAKLNIQTQSREHAIEQLGYCKTRKPELLATLREAEQAYELAYQKNAGNVELLRKHKLLDESARLIRMTKDQLIDNIRCSIEKKVNEFWRGLTWKSDEDIGEVFVDADFRIDLRDKGAPALGTLSAAERALLALSVTLALHSQAGVNFPFVIDTPVANMSLEHRKNFATVLKRLAAQKQITMLFTDTEYVADIPKVFGKDVNSCRMLEFKSGITTIK